jgi:hypothetical protein
MLLPEAAGSRSTAESPLLLLLLLLLLALAC